MTDSPLPEPLHTLAQIPIESFNLSEKALARLKWHGITQVSNCVLFFYNDVQGNIVEEDETLAIIMYGDIRNGMIEQGYWDTVLDDAIWQCIEQHKLYHYSQGKMIVRMHGQDVNLYAIPVEALGLSDQANERLREAYLKRIGDCVHYSLRNLKKDSKDRFGLETLRDLAGASQRIIDFIKLIYVEMEPRLMELGYWRFVEENLD